MLLVANFLTVPILRKILVNAGMVHVLHVGILATNNLVNNIYSIVWWETFSWIFALDEPKMKTPETITCNMSEESSSITRWWGYERCNWNNSMIVRYCQQLRSASKSNSNLKSQINLIEIQISPVKESLVTHCQTSTKTTTKPAHQTTLLDTAVCN